MTNCKLVPFEPTPEMVEAAEDAYMPFGDMDLAIRMAILAAPAVQGEPVEGGPFAWVAVSPCGEMSEMKSTEQCARDLADDWNKELHTLHSGPACHVQPLYTAPQPAEQQPELAKYQPCGCVICTCEHETQCQGCGAKHCGTHLVGQIPGPVYQQTAPDMRGLTEALRQYQHNDGSGLVFGYDKLLVDRYVAQLVEALEWLRGAINATPENDKVQGGTWISTSHPRIKQIDELLASHRKQEKSE